MKRIIILFALMLMYSSCAYCEVIEFEHFSLDVPEGWSAEENGPVVSVTADDRSGSLSITYDDPQGNTIAELAGKFALELGGTNPEKDEEEGTYTFEFNNGVSQAMITGDEDFYMLIIATGFVKNADALTEILDTLEMK